MPAFLEFVLGINASTNRARISSVNMGVIETIHARGHGQVVGPEIGDGTAGSEKLGVSRGDGAGECGKVGAGRLYVVSRFHDL